MKSKFCSRYLTKIQYRYPMAENNAEDGCNLEKRESISVPADLETYPFEDIAYVKSHRMRRVRWSEDLEEIRYFDAKSKRDKQRSYEDVGLARDRMRRRFSDMSNASVEKLRRWLDDKDFKSDVVLLGLKMKSAFKRADFYDAEKQWDSLFEQDLRKNPINCVSYKK